MNTEDQLYLTPVILTDFSSLFFDPSTLPGTFGEPGYA